MQESDFDLKQLHILVAENSFSLEKKQSDIIICVLLLVQEQGSVVQKKKSYNCVIQGIFWEGTLKLLHRLFYILLVQQDSA